jgi:hypothetical protein
VFGGGAGRHFVALAGGQTLSIRQLTRRGAAPPAIGAPMRLGWDAGDAVILDAGQG